MDRQPVNRRQPEPQRHLHVVIACPGVGRIHRGYETFAVGLYSALSVLPETTVSLLEGDKQVEFDPRRFRIRYLRGDRRPARLVGKLLLLDPLTVERLSFALLSLRRLRALRPDVVISSERAMCAVYCRIGRRLAGPFAVVFNNGGNHRPPFRHVDLVKHSSPMPWRWATEASDAAAHVVLEEGVDLPEPSGPTRHEARRQLGLPLEATLVLSVGLLDFDQFKRMQYVVNEVADTGTDLMLALVGQRHATTPELEMLLRDRLGARGVIVTVEPVEVATYYRAADVLVSASTREGFGRVFAEALVHGLPVIAHDDEVVRWVLGAQGTVTDMTGAGNLRAELLKFIANPSSVDVAAAANRFGWDVLGLRYRDMLSQAAGRWPKSLASR